MSRESTRYHSFKSCTLAIDIRGLDLAHCVSLHPRSQTKDACINITLSPLSCGGGTSYLALLRLRLRQLSIAGGRCQAYLGASCSLNIYMCVCVWVCVFVCVFVFVCVCECPTLNYIQVHSHAIITCERECVFCMHKRQHADKTQAF